MKKSKYFEREVKKLSIVRSNENNKYFERKIVIIMKKNILQNKSKKLSLVRMKEIINILREK